MLKFQDGNFSVCFYLADAVKGEYACPQKGVMAANELDIKEDIPEKK